MTETQIEKDPAVPPHHWRDKITDEVYRWGGSATCLCTGCRRLFSSPTAFQRHLRTVVAGDDSHAVCQDPATLLRQDGEPAFEKLDKPAWNPPYVWVKTQATGGDSVPPWQNT